MEADAAFVRADGVVELYTVSQVGLHFAFVVHPCYAECEYSVGFNQPFDDFGFFKFRMLVVDIFNREQHQ